MNPSAKPRVAIYARVSTQQQTEAETIASQVEALRSRVQADGLCLEADGCFLDDGYSGSTFERPGLERLRDAVAAGAIDRLYVHSPDRLSRNYVYQTVLLEEWQRNGVAVVFVNRPIGESPEDQLLLQMQGMIAEYERTKILERCRRGRKHAAQLGLVSALNRAPYGYRYVSKQLGGGQARYEVDDEPARIVQQIFAWVGLERCSLREVVRRLKTRQIPSPTGGTVWEPTTLGALLKNPAYRGEAQFGKTRVGPRRSRLRPARGQSALPKNNRTSYPTAEHERIAIPVPALVDADLFAAVAEQLQENRQRLRAQRRPGRYLLQGLLVCECCGYAFYGKPICKPSGNGERRFYAYYRCIGTDGYRFGGQRVCDNGQCRSDQLDKVVWNDVVDLLADPDRIRHEYQRRREERNRSDGQPSAQLDKLMAAARSTVKRLTDAYEAGVLELADFERRVRSVRERLARLEAERQTTAQREAQAADLDASIGHLETFAQHIGAGLRDADWPTRQKIVRALISEVKIGKEGIRIVYKVKPPFDQSPNGGRILQRCADEQTSFLE